MSIDRIGKGGAPPPAPETSGSGAAGGAQKTGAVFQVERTEGAKQADAAGAVDAAQGASPLARLRAGEIDVHGYIDLKVDEATAGLSGLGPSQLAEIKSVLRDQMATDPGLVDLVRTATGQVPKPPED